MRRRFLKAIPVLTLLFIFGCADNTGNLVGKWYIKRIEYENERKPLNTDSACYYIEFLPEDQVTLKGTNQSEGEWKTRGNQIFIHTTTMDTMDILTLSHDSLAIRFPSQGTYMRYMMSKQKGAVCP